MRELVRDLRFGLRLLAKEPGFTIVATLTPALGIGANTAILSVTNAVLLRPLPYDDPDRLVMIWERSIETGSLLSVPPADWLDWRAQSTAFEGLGAFSSYQFTITGGPGPERLDAIAASSEVLSILRLGPALGRGPVAQECELGRHRVAVLSHELWQRRFGAEAEIVGQDITLSDQPYTVVGVMPAGFQFLDQRPDIWVPLTFTENQMMRTEHFLRVLGRLRQDVTVAAAGAEIETIAGRLRAEHPDTNSKFGAQVVPLREQLVGGSRTGLLVLLGAVGLVLSIAVANVANLQLSRGTARLREMAIRSALGAGRFRIARQLLAESVLLAAIGGAMGVLLAIWGVDLLVRLGPADIYRIGESRVDGAVLGFSLLVSLVTGLAFGLAPALQATRAELTPGLKQGGTLPSRSHHWGRGALASAQIAIALVLLIGAGLLLNGFARLTRVETGFDPEGLLLTRVSLPLNRYATAEEIEGFYKQLLERVVQLPGVESAASTTHPPLVGDWTIVLNIEGRPAVDMDHAAFAVNHAISPAYFKTMKIPMLAGRDFTKHDSARGAAVAIITESFARKYFAGENPLGHRLKWALRWDDPRPWMEIVGVVGDTNDLGLAAERSPGIYLPYSQLPPPASARGMHVISRTSGDPLALAPALRREIGSMEPDAPVVSSGSMEQILHTSVATPRLRSTLIGAFALLALALASVGIYGVVSRSVNQRTSEIGLRMALGATRSDISRLVLSQGARLSLAGLAAGIAGALALTRVLSSFLFGIGARDPMTFAAVSLLLTAAALLACWLPARRAARVDPMTALRCE